MLLSDTSWFSSNPSAVLLRHATLTCCPTGSCYVLWWRLGHGNVELSPHPRRRLPCSRRAYAYWLLEGVRTHSMTYSQNSWSFKITGLFIFSCTTPRPAKFRKIICWAGTWRTSDHEECRMCMGAGLAASLFFFSEPPVLFFSVPLFSD